MIVIHLSPNRYPELKQEFFTKHIWIELSSVCDNYYVIARSTQLKTTQEDLGNIRLIRIASITKRGFEYLFSSLLSLSLIVRKVRGDQRVVVIAQCGFLCYPLIRIFKYMGAEVILEIHADTYFFGSGLINRVRRFFWGLSAKRVDKIRSLSSSMNKVLHAFEEKIYLVPNRADPTLFIPRKINYQRNGVVRLVSVGRFVPQKGYGQFLECLVLSNLEIDVVLVGGGPLKSSYERICEDSKVNLKCIEYLPQKELVPLIRNSDIYVQPSIQGMGEAMPRTLVEAMALAMPIISSNSSFISGVIKDEENGLLYDWNQIDEIINYIEILGENERYRRLLGDSAFIDFTKNYTWVNCFEKYKKLICD